MAKKKTDDKPEPTPAPEAEVATPPAETVIATSPVDPDLTTDLDEDLDSVAQVENELGEDNDPLPEALAVRDPKAMSLLGRGLQGTFEQSEELRTRWTVSVPGYTLPTEVVAFPAPVNAEAAVKAYCDRLGVSRLPTNPRVESAE